MTTTSRAARVPTAANRAASPAVGGPRVFGDPAALGLGAFALTTFVLSVFNAGFLPTTAEPVVLGLALFYGGIAQLIAGIWEFATGNTFGATAFCSYGSFWLAFWYLIAHTDLSAAGADAPKAMGVFLFAWGIFTLYMAIAARRTTLALFVLFILATLTFFALALGLYTGTIAITRIGGWLGLATAGTAWYTSFAVVANSTYKRTVLPVRHL